MAAVPVTSLEDGDDRRALFDNRERTKEITSADYCVGLSSLLPGSVGPFSPLSWMLLLIPELIDPGYHMGEPALHIYQSVQARCPIPAGFRASARTEWVHPHGSSVEVGISCTAAVEGEVIARTLTVSRVNSAGSRVTAFGESRVPDRPQPPTEEPAGAFVVTSGQTTEFASVMHSHYAMHDDPSYAQRQGYSNSLVQGHLLLLELQVRTGMQTAGAVEAWFLRPVPVGAAVTLARGWDDGTECYSMHLGGSKVRAAAARITRFPDAAAG